MDTRRVAIISFLVLAASFESSAATLFSSLLTPSSPVGNLTAINLTGITPPSQTGFSGAGYSVSFSGVASDQGVVQGNHPFPFSFFHAVPVAGAIGPTPQYLTGDFGSPFTTNIAESGNYFSTGLFGTITIIFDTPQQAVALLWGSIDATNTLTFNDSGSTVFTGAQIQSATPGFVFNGFQGVGGSAWVLITTDTPFTTITASTGDISFEFAAVIASPVPEPSSFYLLSSVLCVGALMLLRRNLRRA